MDNIYVTRSSMPGLDEYIDEISDIWDTHWLTNMGKHHNEFEAKLKEYLKTKNLSLFVNGHSALELTLQAMNLSGEVITTPFTFASTTHAIVRNGLQPVFCDISSDNYTIDVTKIENFITDRTTAIVPVHVYGNICGIDEISRIAKKYGLKVIYDAAHAFGERYKGECIANYGDASIFSFHATKVFNAIEGGAAVFEDDRLGEELRKLKNFGIQSEEIVDGIGSNAKMNEFQAAMGVCNLRHFDDEIRKRKIVAERYIENLTHKDGIKLPEYRDIDSPNYAYFPIVIDEKNGKSRNEIYEELKKQNIYSRKYFYPLTNTFECFHNKFDVNDTPVALHTSKRVLTLPIYADLSLENVDRICNIILK